MTSNLGTADLRKAHARLRARRRARSRYEKMKEQGARGAQAPLPARVPEPHRRGHRLPPSSPRTRSPRSSTCMIKRVRDQLEGQGLGLELTHEAKLLLAKRGYDPQLGARPLRRAIQRLVEDPLSEKILWKEFHAGETIVVDADGRRRSPSAPSRASSPAAGRARRLGVRGLVTRAGSRRTDTSPGGRHPSGAHARPHRRRVAGCSARATLSVTMRPDGSGTVAVHVALDAEAVQAAEGGAPLAQRVRLTDLRDAGLDGVPLGDRPGRVGDRAAHEAVPHPRPARRHRRRAERRSRAAAPLLGGTGRGVGRSRPHRPGRHGRRPARRRGPACPPTPRWCTPSPPSTSTSTSSRPSWPGSSPRRCRCGSRSSAAGQRHRVTVSPGGRAAVTASGTSVDLGRVVLARRGDPPGGAGRAGLAARPPAPGPAAGAAPPRPGGRSATRR